MQDKIGQIIINSNARVEPLIGAKDKIGETVFKNIYERVSDAVDEYIEKALSKQVITLDSIPVKDVVTVTIMALDRIVSLYHDSFRYDFAEVDNTKRFTLFWDEELSS